MAKPHTKFLEFLDDIINKQFDGTVQNYFYVVEFQKRGLPHVHLLITLHHRDKLDSAEKVNEIIRSTIADVDSEPMLYGREAENYLHRKCSGQEGSREAACI
ncbi:hypothetical protein HUJ05_005232 [Dendroctonus ponderosae]|nr:hypothetical protein HUJ05_005232 [Dendroctonus ponderosae]